MASLHAAPPGSARRTVFPKPPTSLQLVMTQPVPNPPQPQPEPAPSPSPEPPNQPPPGPPAPTPNLPSYEDEPPVKPVFAR